MEKPIILIVDDDSMMLRAYKRTVQGLLTKRARMEDLRILTADSARSALDLIAEHDRPDLPWMVVSDIEMPEMNGIELMPEIEKRLEHRLVAKLLQSGNHNLREPAEATGALFFTKPTDISNYKELIDTFLSIVF